MFPLWTCRTRTLGLAVRGMTPPSADTTAPISPSAIAEDVAMQGFPDRLSLPWEELSQTPDERHVRRDHGRGRYVRRSHVAREEPLRHAHVDREIEGGGVF